MSAVAENTLNFIANLEATRLPLSENALSAALETLENASLPSTRVEAWKYTRVAKLGKINFTNTIAETTLKTVVDSPYTYVFVNGHFSEDLSSKEMPNGIQISAFSSMESIPVETKEFDIFSAVNAAHMHDGLSINIDKNTVVEQPIQVIHILKGAQQLANFALRVDAGDFSNATIVQGFFAEDATDCFANITSEINVGVNASITLEKVQDEAAGSFHIGTDTVSQDKDSTFTINTMTLNGSLVRNNLNIAVNGQNCTTNLNGGYILKDKQHVDNHTVVDHKVANCNSNELYKGVMDDSSTAVFNGKVFVRKDAQKINAFQSNRNVLLSDSATANSKPELEIYADDVKCSHGSTTGQLDEEAIYYLRARGLSKRAATQLLVSAFISEVISEIETEDVTAYVYRRLQERFGWNINPEDVR